MDNDEELIKHLDVLHTTVLGAKRIRKNLSLDAEDVVAWCVEKIRADAITIFRKGKNWYVEIDDGIITINASSYTIITAHKVQD